MKNIKIFILLDNILSTYADVAEQVDARDLKSLGYLNTRAGSIPAICTIYEGVWVKSFFSFLLLFFLCFDSGVFANRNRDLYAVNNLHISANSNSTTIAKQNAITLAKQQAVSIVANRISFMNSDLLYELKNTDLKNIISTINIYV